VRASASARVVKQSINFGRILFKFDGHLLQMLHGIHTYHVQVSRASVCVRACASARVIKHSLISERILSNFGGTIQHISRGYTSYLICV
jgi:hypothetical protein